MNAENQESLKDVLRANLERALPMTVFNSKDQSVREVTITPSSTWGGQGLLGVSIRFTSFQGVHEKVWHVLDIESGSPAEKAGLSSYVDYIIGADSLLQESEDLFTLIDAHAHKPLKLFVYNYITDRAREVVVTPDPDWGGSGSLGCGIGFGYLHRIPTHRPPPEDRAGESVPSSGGVVNGDRGEPESKEGGPSKEDDSRILESFTQILSLNEPVGANVHAESSSPSEERAPIQSYVPTTTIPSLGPQPWSGEPSSSSPSTFGALPSPPSTATGLAPSMVHFDVVPSPTISAPSSSSSIPPPRAPPFNQSYNEGRVAPPPLHSGPMGVTNYFAPPPSFAPTSSFAPPPSFAPTSSFAPFPQPPSSAPSTGPSNPISLFNPLAPSSLNHPVITSSLDPGMEGMAPLVVSAPSFLPFPPSVETPGGNSNSNLGPVGVAPPATSIFTPPSSLAFTPSSSSN